MPTKLNLEMLQWLREDHKLLEVLKKTKDVAERERFTALRNVVDSLWLWYTITGEDAGVLTLWGNRLMKLFFEIRNREEVLKKCL